MTSTGMVQRESTAVASSFETVIHLGDDSSLFIRCHPGTVDDVVLCFKWAELQAEPSGVSL